MKKIFKSIATGAIKGFPVINSIIAEIKKSKTLTAPANDTPTTAVEKEKFNYVALIAELATVGLIFSFVTKKITIDELLQLIGLLGN